MTEKGPEQGSESEGFHFDALGRAIKVIRTSQGINRSELAERSGLSYPYLSEIENGKKSGSPKVLNNIALALGMRLRDLIDVSEDLEAGGMFSPHMGPAAHAPERRTESRWFHSPDLLAERSLTPQHDLHRARSMSVASTEADPAAAPSLHRLRHEVHKLVDRLSPGDLQLALPLLQRLTLSR